MNDNNLNKTSTNEETFDEVLDIPEEVLQEVKEEDMTPKLNLFSRIIKIIFSPDEVMEDAGKKSYGIMYMVVFAAVLGVLYFLQLGLYREFIYDQILKNPAIDTTNTELVNTSLKMGVIFGGLGYALSVAIISPFFKSVFAHVFSIFVGSKEKFRKTFSVVINAYIIVILGEILRTLLVLVTKDVTASFSLAMLLSPDKQGTIIYTLLGMINVFSIWYLVVSVKGFKIVHKLSTTKAAIVSIVPYLLAFTFSIIPILMRGAM